MTSQRSPGNWLVAHRGWPDRYPENSLEGVRAALEAGARFVEFDVQITADGHPVVIHDDDLSRLTDRSDQVTRLTLAELSEIAIHGPDNRTARIPTLEAMLELLAGFPQATAFVELKRQSIRHHGRTRAVAQVMQQLQHAAGPVVFISFRLLAVRRARQAGARAIGWVIRPWSLIARLLANWLEPDYLFVRANRVPQRSRPFWTGPWQWVIYGIDKPAAAREFIERGADLIEVDNLPDWLEETQDEQP